MTQVAVSDNGRAYKQAMLHALALQPGLTALDVGCGPGADLGGLAVGVSSIGRVIGVDVHPRMVDEARRRMADQPEVEVRVGVRSGVSVEDVSIDRAHADRVLQHLTDPEKAIAEMRRVTRPGGLVALAEPDWATLAIAARDLRTSQAFTDYTCAEVVRHPRIGRQLARLGTGAGFTVRSVTPFSCLFRDVDLADEVLGLTRNGQAAVHTGHLDGPATTAWLADLSTEPFVATVTLFGVLLEAPA
jgi:ubiquinone/menaquinone biosynthesis C-methylase UbiE